jgi:hypothetical protein
MADQGDHSAHDHQQHHGVAPRMSLGSTTAADLHGSHLHGDVDDDGNYGSMSHSMVWLIPRKMTLKSQ